MAIGRRCEPHLARGTEAKTMGDVVMAVFQRSVSGPRGLSGAGGTRAFGGRRRRRRARKTTRDAEELLSRAFRPQGDQEIGVAARACLRSAQVMRLRR